MEPVFIKEIHQQSKKHAEFAYFDIYISEVMPDGTKKVTKLRRDARVIDNLLTNILIAINIMLPNGISILVS
jgi:2-polyprenyl-3-methyl-5-hydroxy-6-metoxy-1,4-benzoquinol methylase